MDPDYPGQLFSRPTGWKIVAICEKMVATPKDGGVDEQVLEQTVKIISVTGNLEI